MGPEFTKPLMEYASIWPLFVVFGVACLGLLAEAFLPRERRHGVQVVLAVAGLLAALVGTVLIGMDLEPTEGGAARGLIGAAGSVVVDGPTVFIWGLLLVFALGGVALFAERRLESGVSAFAGQAAALPGTEAERRAQGLDHSEVYPLLMFAVTGMLLFPASGDLLTMFVALEVLSLPLYLLCGLARRRRLLSQEAALKYFLLGAFSSGFFLYGVALVYGFAGSMDLAAIDAAVRNDTGNRALLLVGIGMLMVGVFFKVGAVPFHSWTPDVYQGAPTAVTAFMAAGTKVAAFGAMLRLLYVAFGAERWSWQPMLWVVAILTMLVGAVLAIVQTDVKRMLAYSAIAHTGFLITGVLGVQSASELAEGQITALQSVLFYLAAYSFATMGAFAIVTLVRDSSGEATRMARWAGLGRRSPIVAGAFAFFLLSMAGIPLTAGFTGKWAVFTVALAAGAWPVVLVAILASVLSVYFYVNQIRIMYFAEPEGEVASVTTPSMLTTVVIAVGVIGTLALGVVPGPVLDLAADAGQFIR
ncbi:NADH-quinone oxidoreductase subunit N [Nocardioides dokdonensis FR1436]|uniref:NADH-quinone oxidoreductase subunit N n=1 Tax=Nocardioides dokdonensis FR1436 TaxID=1300347 RepID=A0A1A9GG26_9ACTN|nr:NADH-quinone oxidoreductase subunit NuoN [Nocardioides dokdonensis]ANH37218.1 NADH-quinone oxidoreductase subunit N [Nocardioides dokdonensis FR1436]